PELLPRRCQHPRRVLRPAARHRARLPRQLRGDPRRGRPVLPVLLRRRVRAARPGRPAVGQRPAREHLRRLRDARVRLRAGAGHGQRRRARGAHREQRRRLPDLSQPGLRPYLGAGESEPIGARNSYTDVLPSANLKWEPAQDLVVRFAASRAVARPAFSDMQAVQLLSVEPREGVTAPDDGSTLPLEDLQLTDTSTDNPYLTPMRANQFDLSLEWYFAPDRGGMAWVNLFHKSVKDYFRQQTRLEPHPGADGNQYNYLASRMVNVGTATIRGAELGWNQFFDFLPTPFDGLGMSVNYTYIDS